MKTLPQWLQEYGKSHTNPTNILIHKICVPLIMFSLLGMMSAFSPIFAFSFITLVMVFFYAPLKNPRAFFLMLTFSLVMLLITQMIEHLTQMSLTKVSLSIFITAWIFQFIGHKIEGKKPSFIKDLQFLLVGPLWTLHFYFPLYSNDTYDINDINEQKGFSK
jgi:uncharacterized membrane protein YGL010W